MAYPVGSAGSLATYHLATLRRLGITPELISSAEIHSVTDAQAREEGFQVSDGSDLSGMVFPYRDLGAGRRVTARLRRDHSPCGAKYVSPYGDRRHLYFPPGVDDSISDVSVLAVVVEAEKSALAIGALGIRSQRKFLPIATGGCWGWRGKIGIESDARGIRQECRGPLPDFDRVDWEQRTVVILFDSKVATKPPVAARSALARELAARGASVKIGELPQLDGVNGPDDLIAVCGDSALLMLLDSARTLAACAQAQAEKAIASLEADRHQDPDPLFEAIADVPDPLRREILVGTVVALKIPGLTKVFVRKEVASKLEAQEANIADTTERVSKERLQLLRVNPAELLADLERFYADRRHLPEDAAFLEALFALNSHTFDVFDTTPYLLYDSATGGCGKSTTLERHQCVCARPYVSVDTTAAVVFRKIDRDRPTFLLDEAKILQIQGERGQELLALFDAGYKRSAVVSRCEGRGGIRDFQVFCPKVLARIGSFRGTLLDRGIVVHLEKARGLRQLRHAVLMRIAAPLKEKIEAYAVQHREGLERFCRGEPDDGYWPVISGREAELWGPLLYHARLAGPDVERRALKIALRYSNQKEQLAVSEDQKLALSHEALEVLQSFQCAVFRPKDLIGSLAEKDTWGDRLANRKNDKAKATVVGSFFRDFRLQSRTHVEGGSQYQVSDAIAALERHLPEVLEGLEERVSVSTQVVSAVGSADCPSDTKLDGEATLASNGRLSADAAVGERSLSSQVSSGQPAEKNAISVEADTLDTRSRTSAGSDV